MMDTTIQKSYYSFLDSFIKEHLNMLLHARVFIFGAGIRGTNLLCLLRLYDVQDIFFVDNNPQKQGTEIDGCHVLSFSEADSYNGKHVFLCPIENGKQILEQLALTRRCENVDYFNLDFQFTDYLDIIEDIKHPMPDYSLAFGCCILSSNLLGNKFSLSLGERLKEEILPGNCKICTLPGFSPAMNYYIIKKAIEVNKSQPRLLFLTMEISSCSPYAPLMLGKQNYLQHELFVEQLTQFTPVDDELNDYLQLIKERKKRYTTVNNSMNSDDFEDVRKRVYKLKYNYNLREDDESVIYTKKILTLANQRSIPVVLFFPPVDYMYAETVCGVEFTAKYNSIIKSIQSFLVDFSYRCIDASFIASSDDFIQQMNSPDINPFLNEAGQNLLLNFLKEQEKIQLFY